MYRGVEVLRLVPDRAGRGGTKFGYHSFQQEPINDTRQTFNVHVWQDSWRSDGKGYDDPLLGAVFPDTNLAAAVDVQAMSLHGYCKYSTYNPAAGPMTEILGHNTGDPSNVDTRAGYVWNYSSYVDWTVSGGGGVFVYTWDKNVVCPASPTSPAVFVNIGSRCFIATGTNECQIYDSSRGADVFGNGSGQPHVYSLGIGAPEAVPLIPSAGPVTSQTDAWLHTGSKYLTDPDPNGGLSSAVAVEADTIEMDADGVLWSGATGFDLKTGSGTSVFDTTGMFVSIPNGSNIATFSGAAIPADNGWIMLTLTVDGKTFKMMAFGNAGPAELPALGPLECRLSDKYRGPRNNQGPRDPEAPPADPPLPIWDPAYDIDAQPFSVTGYRWEMEKGGAPLLWPGGLSGKPTIKGTLLNNGGRITWTDTPPSYAYAWYDPVTGHVSNISPTFTPPESAMTDGGIAVPIDVGQISYPVDTTSVPRDQGTGSPFPRWTHILFFRTLMGGGSTLYPIGSLQPWLKDPVDPLILRQNPEWRGLPNELAGQFGFPPTTTGNFWYDSARDSDLLISGALRAPQFTNSKPTYTNEGETITLFPAHMAYWDGRLWTACTQDPAALHYSCDRVQCPFGVPEESFPDTNVLRIPASDGCIRGMKLIGESLLITTEKWAYTIAGNNEANYRLVRVSTRMAGVGDYQMDEFVSDVEGQTTLVVFIGTDSKVYAMPLGGEAVHISKEIQTFFTSLDLSNRESYYLSRVHCMSVGGRRMALVYTPGPYVGGTTSHYGKTFIYDFDQRLWTEHTLATDDSDSGQGIPGQGRHTAWASVSTSIDHNAEIYAAPTNDITPPTLSYPNVKVRRWFGPTGTPGYGGGVPMRPGHIETFPLTFDGKKTRKQLHFVRLYVNDASGTTVSGQTYYGWRIELRKDSAPPLAVTPVQEMDPAYRLMPSGTIPVDSATDAELIATDAMFSPDTPIIGYTFGLKITFPDHTDNLFRLYRVDIGWSTVSEGQIDP